MNDRGYNDLEETIERLEKKIYELEKKIDLKDEEIQILNIQLTKKETHEQRW